MNLTVEEITEWVGSLRSLVPHRVQEDIKVLVRTKQLNGKQFGQLIRSMKIRELVDGVNGTMASRMRKAYNSDFPESLHEKEEVILQTPSTAAPESPLDDTRRPTSSQQWARADPGPRMEIDDFNAECGSLPHMATVLSHLSEFYGISKREIYLKAQDVLPIECWADLWSNFSQSESTPSVRSEPSQATRVNCETYAAPSPPATMERMYSPPPTEYVLATPQPEHRSRAPSVRSISRENLTSESQVSNTQEYQVTPIPDPPKFHSRHQKTSDEVTDWLRTIPETMIPARMMDRIIADFEQQNINGEQLTQYVEGNKLREICPEANARHLISIKKAWANVLKENKAAELAFQNFELSREKCFPRAECLKL